MLWFALFAVCDKEETHIYWLVGLEYFPELAATYFAHFPSGIKESHGLFVKNQKKRDAAKFPLRFEPLHFSDYCKTCAYLLRAAPRLQLLVLRDVAVR